MTAVPDREVVEVLSNALGEELSTGTAVSAAFDVVEAFREIGWTVEAGGPVEDEIHVEFAGVDLTPKWITLGDRTFDVIERGRTAPATDASIVATTLDYLSSWFDEEPADLRARAEQIRRYQEDGWDTAACCPVCAEVVCDDDCPLWSLRDAAGVWVGSSGARRRSDDEPVGASFDVEEPETIEVVDGEPDSAEQVEEFVVDCEIVDEEVETINDTMVSIRGTGDDVMISWIGIGGVRRETALRHAAWVVSLADPLDERFPIIRQAVMST